MDYEIELCHTRLDGISLFGRFPNLWLPSGRLLLREWHQHQDSVVMINLPNRASAFSQDSLSFFSRSPDAVATSLAISRSGCSIASSELNGDRSRCSAHGEDVRLARVLQKTTWQQMRQGRSQCCSLASENTDVVETEVIQTTSGQQSTSKSHWLPCNAGVLRHARTRGDEPTKLEE